MIKLYSRPTALHCVETLYPNRHVVFIMTMAKAYLSYKRNTGFDGLHKNVDWFGVRLGWSIMSMHSSISGSRISTSLGASWKPKARHSCTKTQISNMAKFLPTHGWEPIPNPRKQFSLCSPLANRSGSNLRGLSYPVLPMMKVLTAKVTPGWTIVPSASEEGSRTEAGTSQMVRRVTQQILQYRTSSY